MLSRAEEHEVRRSVCVLCASVQQSSSAAAAAAAVAADAARAVLQS